MLEYGVPAAKMLLTGKTGSMTRVKELVGLPDNLACADCRGEDGPRLCNVTLGVVICSECAVAHRKLGKNISDVQSTTQDLWKSAWVDKLSSVGNKVAAELYEAALPSNWPRPRVESSGGDRLDGISGSLLMERCSARVHLERFIRAKYEQRLFARADMRLEADAEDEPFAEEFDVLLRRGPAKEAFGFAPVRSALRRGVLEIKAPVAPDTPAWEWNALQGDKSLHLQSGDCILSVNGVRVCREDAGDAALQHLMQEQQVLLSVLRPRPMNQRHGYEQLLGIAYGLFNPWKLGSGQGRALLAKNRGGEKALCLRICSKYAVTSEDWLELFDALAERCNGIDGGGARAARMTSKAVARLKLVSPEEKPALLESLCRHLYEEVGSEVDSAWVEPQEEPLQADYERKWKIREDGGLERVQAEAIRENEKLHAQLEEVTKAADAQKTDAEKERKALEARLSELGKVVDAQKADAEKQKKALEARLAEATNDLEELKDRFEEEPRNETGPQPESPKIPVQENREVPVDHLTWPQLTVSMPQPDPTRALGVRHSKTALQKFRMVLVRGVVQDSPAAAMGLRKGDVLERIAGEEAVEYLLATALRGYEGRETSGELVMTVRRQEMKQTGD